MQNRSNFDQEWENAFSDAEMDVSPGLWEKVEVALIAASNGKYKKRLLLFQILAAASVAFALSVGGVGVYHLYNENTSNTKVQVASKADVPNAPQEGATEEEKHLTAADSKETGSKEENTTVADRSQAGTSVHKDNVLRSKTTSNQKTDNNVFVPAPRNKEKVAPHTSSSGLPAEKSRFLAGDNSTAGKPVLEAKSVAPLFAYLEIEQISEREPRMVPWYSYIPEEKQLNNKGLWAGIGFSTGTFNPNTTSVNTPAPMQTFAFDANAKRVPSFTEEKAGQAINMGINVGSRISDKWVLQTGFVYIQQQTSSTSNVVSTNNGETAQVLSNATEISETEELAFTAPYDVNNTYELISVPMQAGYILLDKKLSITLLSGVSNNILLRNEIGSRSGNFDDAEVSAGSGSQYRTYQICGMFGSEFSYVLGSNYSLSLVPQVRQAINSIIKSEMDYSSRPTTLEIGFKLKYIFRKEKVL